MHSYHQHNHSSNFRHKYNWCITFHEDSRPRRSEAQQETAQVVRIGIAQVQASRYCTYGIASSGCTSPAATSCRDAHVGLRYRYVHVTTTDDHVISRIVPSGSESVIRPSLSQIALLQFSSPNESVLIRTNHWKKSDFEQCQELRRLLETPETIKLCQGAMPEYHELRIQCGYESRALADLRYLVQTVNAPHQGLSSLQASTAMFLGQQLCTAC
jgi:hypothetical protein